MFVFDVFGSCSPKMALILLVAQRSDQMLTCMTGRCYSVVQVGLLASQQKLESQQQGPLRDG